MFDDYCKINEAIQGSYEIMKQKNFNESRAVKLAKGKTKNGTVQGVQNWRPLQIVSNSRKAYEKALVQLQSLMDYQDFNIQYGGWQGKSMTPATIKVIRHTALGRPTILLDISKAYDQMCRVALTLIWRAKAAALDTLLQRYALGA